MQKSPLMAEAVRRVRSRYATEDFANLFLDRLIDETRQELERLKYERIVTCGSQRSPMADGTPCDFRNARNTASDH